MKRVLHASAFNLIANEPSVRPWLGGVEPIDLTPVISDPNNLCFLTDDDQGGYIYHKRAPGLFEVHCLSFPTGRGRAMLEARSASLRAVFTQSDAVEVITKVPDGNKGADIWAAHAGFREVFRREKAFDLMGEMVGVSYRSLSYGDWVLKDRKNKQNGWQFHEIIHALTPDDHGDDPVHDHWVGATLEGCDQGNVEKAIALYNRHAVHAGYETIQVVTLHPLVLDIRSCILQYDASGLQVLHIRQQREAHSVEDVPESAECPSPRSVPLQA